MSFVVLDIGAGSLTFARGLAWKNWGKRLLIFCGEPNWSAVSLVCNTITPEDAAWKMERRRTGRYRIKSSYCSFAFADQSLDLVTLNAPCPLGPPVGIEKELERCLKPSGLFFYSYPLLLYQPKLEQDFTCLKKDKWSKRGNAVHIESLAKTAPDRFPPSRIIKNNIRAQRLRDNRPDLYEKMFSAGRPMSSYLYSGTGVAPEYQLWVKH